MLLHQICAGICSFGDEDLVDDEGFSVVDLAVGSSFSDGVSEDLEALWRSFLNKEALDLLEDISSLRLLLVSPFLMGLLCLKRMTSSLWTSYWKCIAK